MATNDCVYDKNLYVYKDKGVMDKKTMGAWIVHHTNKLQKVNSQANYENIFLAGKAGILLSAISFSDQNVLNNNKIKTLARASNINVQLELPELLKLLVKHDLIDIGNNGVEILGLTSSATLQHITAIYDNASPTSLENASLELSEKASIRPQDKKHISTEMSDLFKLDSSLLEELFDNSEDIGFIDVEDIDKEHKLYFNGNLFRRDETAKISAVLSSLSSKEEHTLNEFNELLLKITCVSVQEAKKRLGELLFNKISSIGLFDINVISNETEDVGFVTRPSAFSKFSNSLVEDAFDLAKAFVASLTYGMTKSSYSRGQITMIGRLLEVLISGGWVGPVNAIGQDYRILELKGVVEVKYAKRKGRNGYVMRLLKKEVGELALQAITSGDVSEQSLSDFPGAAVNKFICPEDNREIERKKQLKQNPKAANNMLMVLRTGGGY